MRRQIWVNMGHQLAGRQSKSYDTKQTEPDFQLTFFKLSWRIWEVWSQEITAFLTGTLSWSCNQTKPQGWRRSKSFLNSEVSFTGNEFNETITQKASRDQPVLKILHSKTEQDHHQEVRQRAIRGVMLCCTMRQWIIILVGGETLSIWQCWGPSLTV